MKLKKVLTGLVWLFALVLAIQLAAEKVISWKSSKEQSAADMFHEEGSEEAFYDPDKPEDILKWATNNMRVYMRSHAVDYLIHPFETIQSTENGVKIIQIFNDKLEHSYCPWSVGQKGLGLLTGEKRHQFYINTHRQRSNGETVDHLVFALEDIKEKFCSGPIRSFNSETELPTSTAVVVEDENYADGCAKNASGRLFYFFEISREIRSDVDNTKESSKSFH